MMNGAKYNDPDTGYPKWIDIDSFVDFFLISEISKNVDCYRLSTFLYKDRNSKDPRLHIGPIWDYNLAFGLANYYDGEDTDGWMLETLLTSTGEDFPVPFWWKKLFEDPPFNHRIKQRWVELRSGPFDVARIHAFIDATADTLAEAAERNFAIWPAPGQPGEGFWPMPNVFYSFRSYRDETNYLKYWISERVKWMDANVLRLSQTLGRKDALPTELRLKPAYPNPFNPSTVIEYELPREERVRIDIFNARGQKVRTLVEQSQSAGIHSVTWQGDTQEGTPAAAGVYYCRLVGESNGDVAPAIKLLLLR